MIRVAEHSKELYNEFRSQFGRMSDSLRLRIARVNDTISVTDLESVNIESVMFQAYFAGASQIGSLQSKINGLKALCEQNDIEIPDERQLAHLGRK